MENNDLKQALLQAFSEEAPELMQKAQTALLDMESAKDKDNLDHINTLKRALHSLKGSASAIGREDIRDVTHTLENMLSGGVINSQIVDGLYTGLSFLNACVNKPEEPQDVSEIVGYLQIIYEGSISSSGINNEAIYAQVSEKLENDVLEEDNVKPGISSGMEYTQPASVAGASILNETIRVSVSKIENMQSSLSELVAMRLMQKDAHDKLLEIQACVASANKFWQLIKNEISELRLIIPPAVASRMNAKTSDYSSQIKNIQRNVFHLSNQIGSQVGQLNLLSDEIDTGLRSIRMMPIGPFLESYRTIAREAARQLNKMVVVECVDRGIEIDRLILEKIKEPIMHIVRNCVSHGIESKSKRVSSGKAEAGCIRIKSELNGEYVLIRITDDGSGYNTQRIREEAIRHGLMKVDEELTNSKILEFVTRSGFSTSRQADLVSGRGVGMDVVATMLAELGGIMELETQEGKGSSIILRVPSSLAISQGLILRIGNRRYGIVLDTVERIVRTNISSIQIVEGKQVFYINDEPIAVCSLASLLNLHALVAKNTQHPMPMVVLRVGSQRLALIVDEIPGEIPMVIKTMGPQFDHVAVYSGGSILSDGSVLPVLDARHLVKMVGEHRPVYLNASEDSENSENDHIVMHTVSESLQRTIIVVDDSITTRTLERNILEAAGYRVTVATDGIEALDLLMMEDNVSLVVTDLEMPRMNGVELCKNIRAGRYADLPIIMVTSVGDATEMKKGIQAGADAYIIKGDFQQEHFLETVKRFVQ